MTATTPRSKLVYARCTPGRPRGSTSSRSQFSTVAHADHPGALEQQPLADVDDEGVAAQRHEWPGCGPERSAKDRPTVEHQHERGECAQGHAGGDGDERRSEEPLVDRLDPVDEPSETDQHCPGSGQRRCRQLEAVLVEAEVAAGQVADQHEAGGGDAGGQALGGPTPMIRRRRRDRGRVRRCRGAGTGCRHRLDCNRRGPTA